MTDKRKDLIVTAASGLLIIAFVYFNTADFGYSIVHRICDGCFVTGVMLFGAGIILHCSNKGALNLFGYSAKFGLSLIVPVGKNPWTANGERETYYDYCERKAKQEPKPISHLLIVGGAYLAIAVVLLIIYLMT